MKMDKILADFWKAINLWIYKPHVLNKRLWGVIELERFEVLSSKLENRLKCFEEMKQIRINFDVLNFVDSKATSEAVITKLLPKSNTNQHSYQLTVLDRLNSTAYFFNLNENYNLTPSFPYKIGLKQGEVVIDALYDMKDERSLKWLKGIVLPQIIKWCNEEPQHRSNLNIKSLSLVVNEQYHKLYNELKLKYGKQMVKIWPECTDPLKFVYEDIAIACYLILLWQEERIKIKSNKLQTFVDLGCGNGLLVYILNSEGHQGYGIDVRKRNIWDVYPDFVCLKEYTITPSSKNLFPESDWIIGNHSDELSPWIPIIAARSSYNCNFFLLPCCPYNFDGSKYQRIDSSKSQYSDYIDYLMKICKICKFNIKCDRLKIPSTKRICIVSFDRQYSLNDYESVGEKIAEFINQEDNVQWLTKFKPRSAVEKVRNCTQIDRNIVDNVIKIIANHLLSYPCQHWNEGLETELKDLVDLLPEHLLVAMKNECGGLQTLLKNNHQIFKVTNGKVKFRYPLSMDEVKNKNKTDVVKKRMCWFYINHPQGCPLTDINCCYLH